MVNNWEGGMLGIPLGWLQSAEMWVPETWCSMCVGKHGEGGWNILCGTSRIEGGVSIHSGAVVGVETALLCWVMVGMCWICMQMGRWCGVMWGNVSTRQMWRNVSTIQ